MVTEDCIAKRERERVEVKQPSMSVYRTLFRKKLNGFRLIAGHFRCVRKIAKSDC